MNDSLKPSIAAEEQGVCHTDAECYQMYAALTPELKAPVLKMLSSFLAGASADIKVLYARDPENWIAGHHFGWGMAVRNLLRHKGFGEDYFGIHNLDDIYVALVEEALKLKEAA